MGVQYYSNTVQATADHKTPNHRGVFVITINASMIIGILSEKAHKTGKIKSVNDLTPSSCTAAIGSSDYGSATGKISVWYSCMHVDRIA